MQTKDACLNQEAYAKALSAEIDQLRFEIQRIHAHEQSTAELECQVDRCNGVHFGQQTDNEGNNVELIDEGTQTPRRKEQESTQTVGPFSETQATQTSYYDQFELLLPSMEQPAERRATGTAEAEKAAKTAKAEKTPKTIGAAKFINAETALQLETRTARGREVYWCDGLALPKYKLRSTRK